MCPPLLLLAIARFVPSLSGCLPRSLRSHARSPTHLFLLAPRNVHSTPLILQFWHGPVASSPWPCSSGKRTHLHF